MKSYTYLLLAALLLLLLTTGYSKNDSLITLSSMETSSTRTISDKNSITPIRSDFSSNVSSVGQFINSRGWIDIPLNAQWKEIGNEVIIQIQNVIPNIVMYYGDITLESGSRIAVKLGRPDDAGRFKIKNTFGKFTAISIYTDLDLEWENSPSRS